MNAVFKIRLTACTMWIVSGILSNSLPGYLSSVASFMFIAAMLLEGQHEKK